MYDDRTPDTFIYMYNASPYSYVALLYQDAFIVRPQTKAENRRRKCLSIGKTISLALFS